MYHKHNYEAKTHKFVINLTRSRGVFAEDALKSSDGAGGPMSVATSSHALRLQLEVNGLSFVECKRVVPF